MLTVPYDLLLSIYLHRIFIKTLIHVYIYINTYVYLPLDQLRENRLHAFGMYNVDTKLSILHLEVPIKLMGIARFLVIQTSNYHIRVKIRWKKRRVRRVAIGGKNRSPC